MVSVINKSFLFLMPLRELINSDFSFKDLLIGKQSVIAVAQKIESPLIISFNSYFLFKSDIPDFFASLISLSLSNKNLP